MKFRINHTTPTVPHPRVAIPLLLLASCLAVGGVSASAASARWSSSNAQSAADEVVTLTTRDPSGTTREVDGITCDNLAGDEGATANSLQVRCPLFTPATRIDARLTNADGSVVDATGAANTGHLAEDAAHRPTVNGGALTYYPPAEFNLVQAPRAAAELTLPATRPVLLSLTVTKPDGSIVRLPTTRILLARPPVVLIHGINTPPSDWRPLTEGISGSGTGALRLRIPFVTVNHYDLLAGNAPVEVGAARLENTLASVLSALREGTPLSDAATGFQFRDCAGVRLAVRKADVVAWSYGGVIARWYLASAGSNVSWNWYRRPVSGPKVTSRYRNDVRKLITLGSMWRGVPLANYVNEVLNQPLPKIPRLSQAPVPIEGLGTITIGDAVPRLETPTRVPSMEVMAVNSPWLSQLLYGSPNAPSPGQTRTAAPCLNDVAYGSVAGDNNRYPLRVLGSNAVSYDAYTTVDEVQQPSWFPYLALEQRAGSTRNYSDGIVPVWTSALPGSYQIAPATHGAYPQDLTTRDYLARWLNNATLPRGEALNEIWNDERRSVIQTPGRPIPWSFQPDRMAPDPQDDLYQRVLGAGRLHPQAVREIVTARAANVTPTSAEVTWLTAIGTDSTVTVKLGKGQKRNVVNPAPVRIHTLAVTGLRPNSTYSPAISSRVPVEPGGGRNGQAPILRMQGSSLRIKTLPKGSSYVTLQPVSSDPNTRRITVRVTAHGAVSSLRIIGCEFTVGSYTLAGATPATISKLASGAQQDVVLTYRDTPAVRDIPALFAQVSCQYRNAKRKRQTARSPWVQAL